MSYKKLVRDNIPNIIRKNGEKPIVRTLGDTEYLHELIKKLHEEVTEFSEDLSQEELADIYEVLLALTHSLGYDTGEIETIRQRKAAKNGAFEQRIYLEGVE